jgi:hypothetical protein
MKSEKMIFFSGTSFTCFFVFEEKESADDRKMVRVRLRIHSHPVFQFFSAGKRKFSKSMRGHEKGDKGRKYYPLLPWNFGKSRTIMKSAI